MTPPRFTTAVGQGRFLLIQGDLTRSETDAIVNAANASLAGGGGVDGAIHRAAGPELLAVCLDIVAKQGRLPTGQAVITPGFNLSARFVIHTVGPIWRGGRDKEPELLADCYHNCLKLAAENNVQTIAFPAISCGVYGFPINLAIPIALRAIQQGLMNNLVREAHMYAYSPASLDAWEQGARNIFE